MKPNAQDDVTAHVRRMAAGDAARVVRLVRPIGWGAEKFTRYLDLGVQRAWWQYRLRSDRGVQSATLTLTDSFVDKQ